MMKKLLSLNVSANYGLVFKMRNKQFGLVIFMIFVVFIVFAFFGNSTIAAMTLENENKELPTPISFIDSSKIDEGSVLIESISFELSEINATQTYLITKGYEDLIFSFKDVSAPINFSLRTENEDSHCAGFSGATNIIYIKTNPNSEYEFNWSLGFMDCNDTAKQMDLVDSSSRVLEIFKVVK